MEQPQGVEVPPVPSNVSALESYPVETAQGVLLNVRLLLQRKRE